MSTRVRCDIESLPPTHARLQFVRAAREFESLALRLGLSRLQLAVRNGLDEDALLNELFHFAEEQSRIRSVTDNAIRHLGGDE